MSGLNNTNTVSTVAARKSSTETITEQTRMRYAQTYNQFLSWKAANKVKSSTEVVLLAYFQKMNETYESSTLWNKYSILTSKLMEEENVNIREFKDLKAFLHSLSPGYAPYTNKTKTLTAEQIATFIKNADDFKYLGKKAILIAGISGGLRRVEIYNMKVEDVTFQLSSVWIKVRMMGTGRYRQFVIKDEFFHIFKKYALLRPANATSDKFFLKYKNNNCYNQVMGIISIGRIPKDIAIYLKLPNADNYTGHSFRRMSAMLLSNTGSSRNSVMEQSGWTSRLIAQNFIDQSNAVQIEVANRISSSIRDAIKPRSAIRSTTGNKSTQQTSNSTVVNQIPLSRRINSVVEIKQSDPFELSESNDWFLEEYLMEDDESISDSNAKRLKLDSDIPKSSPEMQKNLLKRLRTNFDRMTRDDLEKLITIKICDTIINNSEFKMLRTIVENQSKTIKTYKEQLISIVKQYDKLKVIIEYLTSALKLKNGKHQKPLRITRSVAVQRNAPSVPISLNVVNQKGNTKNDQLPLPSEKPSVTLQSIPIKMTPGNSSIQQRSSELNVISDSKTPKIVFINSGKTILNARGNTSAMKLSSNVQNNPSNAFKKCSSNVQPKINSYIISPHVPAFLLLNSNITFSKKVSDTTETQVSDILPNESPQQSNFNKLPVDIGIPHRDNLDALETVNSKAEITVKNEKQETPLKNQPQAIVIGKINSKESLSKGSIIPYTANNNLTLPDEQKNSYVTTHKHFKSWQNKRGIKSCSEDVLLLYFYDIAKTNSPSSLPSIYSQLQKTILSNERVNIAHYMKLKSYLLTINPECTKTCGTTQILSKGNVLEFLKTAPDSIYLATKAVIIIAISGRCQMSKIHGLKINDIVFFENERATITFAESKDSESKSFSLTGEFLKFFKKYADMRPKNVSTNYFFLKYLNGMCYDQVIEKDILMAAPKIIATYLNLPESNAYTGLD